MIPCMINKIAKVKSAIKKVELAIFSSVLYFNNPKNQEISNSIRPVVFVLHTGF